jgi:hypothetical protein
MRIVAPTYRFQSIVLQLQDFSYWSEKRDPRRLSICHRDLIGLWADIPNTAAISNGSAMLWRLAQPKRRSVFSLPFPPR